MLFSILFLIGFSILRDCSGCKYHPGCCIPNDEIENATLKQNVWNIKKRWQIPAFLDILINYISENIS